MSLDFSITNSFISLIKLFRYNIFIAIVISTIIFSILFLKNKNNKIIKYILLFINLILIIVINYYYLDNFISLKFSNPINNLYFYFLNSIIFIIIFSIKYIRFKINIVDIIFYGLKIIGILFSIFMINYLYNSDLLVLCNIYPLVKFGNILSFIYYIVLLTKIIKHVIIHSSFKGVK